MKKTLLILGLTALLVAGATLPAVARERVPEVERSGTTRTFPPAWVDMSIEDLRAEVGERAERAIARVERSVWLSDSAQSQLLAAVDALTRAVAESESNPEVVGLSISRVQLQRSELRSERRGTTIDHDAHIATDTDRAERRLERLTKVVTWAEAAGEDVPGIGAMLEEAGVLLETAYGEGTVEERHDAAHISLAWLVEADVAHERLSAARISACDRRPGGRQPGELVERADLVVDRGIGVGDPAARVVPAGCDPVAGPAGDVRREAVAHHQGGLLRRPAELVERQIEDLRPGLGRVDLTGDDDCREERFEAKPLDTRPLHGTEAVGDERQRRSGRQRCQDLARSVIEVSEAAHPDDELFAEHRWIGIETGGGNQIGEPPGLDLVGCELLSLDSRPQHPVDVNVGRQMCPWVGHTAGGECVIKRQQLRCFRVEEGVVEIEQQS